MPLPLKITNTIIDIEHKLFSSPINKIDLYIRFLWCTRTTNLHQTLYTSMYCMSETCSLIRYWFFFLWVLTLVSFRFVSVHVGLLKDISSFLCYLWMVLLQAMYKKDIILEFHSNILFGLVGAHTWIARSEHWSVCVSGEIWSLDTTTWDSYLLLDCLPGNWVTSRAVFSFICCRTNLNQMESWLINLMDDNFRETEFNSKMSSKFSLIFLNTGTLSYFSLLLLSSRTN